MAPPPEVPHLRRGPSVPVQREARHDPAAPPGDDQEPGDHVPAAWLVDPEHMDAADRVDRLAADHDMITGLALEGFSGASYDVFQTELARYGRAVIGGWIRRGLILTRCRDRGFGGLPQPPAGAFDDPDVVAELADETVAKALHHFRTEVLMKHQWNPRRGASIRTYFIGQCLIRFANIYRKWHDVEARRGYHLADLETLDGLERRQVPSVAELVADQDLAERLLSRIGDPETRQALRWAAQDISQKEIARRLGITEKAVERLLAKARNHIRNRKRGIA